GTRPSARLGWDLARHAPDRATQGWRSPPVSAILRANEQPADRATLPRRMVAHETAG
ncbi:MAG: hypothetical protein QOG73_3043, partial [Acetobacteraceae bacterium]|nr:hypothetical protein [Acetobacteraceae bacterium]